MNTLLGGFEDGWKLGPYCLHHQRLISLMMEAVKTSETLLNSRKSARSYNPEDSHLTKNRPRSLKVSNDGALQYVKLFFFLFPSFKSRNKKLQFRSWVLLPSWVKRGKENTKPIRWARG
jgi:hypothetical protein